MRRFKSAGQAQRFLSAFGIITSHFRPGRHLCTVGVYREMMRPRGGTSANAVEESSVRFGTVKLYCSKTKKWRTIKAPSAAALIANRKAARQGSTARVLTQPDHWYREILKEASESVGIRYDQRVPGEWTTHDLRHTCLTNLAMAAVPINGIKEYAGHASIVETQKYLKFMPQSIDLAASVSTRLGEHAKVQPEPNNAPAEKALGLVNKSS